MTAKRLAIPDPIRTDLSGLTKAILKADNRRRNSGGERG
jgi:hypothetical protein